MRQKVKTPPTKQRENDLLTPEAPSIAFPLANPLVAPEPQVKGQVYIIKRLKTSTYMGLYFAAYIVSFRQAPVIK